MFAALLWSGLVMSGPSGFHPPARARMGVTYPGDLGVEQMLIPLEVRRRIKREPGGRRLYLEEHIKYHDGLVRYTTYWTP